MKKLLIVRITQTIDVDKQDISLLAAEIDCSSNDEIHIKRAIESTRNPNVLSAIITQNMTQKNVSEIKPTLDEIRVSIAKSDSIQAGFLPIGRCDNNCAGCILDGLHAKMEAMQKIVCNKELFHLCPN